MFGASPLTKALRTWIKEGGSLWDALEDLENQITNRKEADALLDALRHHQNGTRPDTGDDEPASSNLHCLTALFQNVEASEAFERLVEEGLPGLRWEVQNALNGEPIVGDDVLFVLKVLALYRQEEDVALIARAARAGYEEDAYMWSIIFNVFQEEHPHLHLMIDALRDPLPTGFIAVSYLDLCNSAAIASQLEVHPFASAPGLALLTRWLQSEDKEQFSYAHSTTAALPFVPEAARNSLLDLAQRHPSVGVRLEAAWASARTGDRDGLAQLAEFCRDPNHSTTAQQYLSELGAADEIPEPCKDPNFQALAEMAHWLAHPQEFGRPPTRMEILDTRELHWPPTEDERRLWLVKYTYDEPGEETDIGVGMVGSITFALFGEATIELSPEDIYGLHCCWELQAREDPRAPEERTPAIGRQILAEHNEGF